MTTNTAAKARRSHGEVLERVMVEGGSVSSKRVRIYYNDDGTAGRIAEKLSYMWCRRRDSALCGWRMVERGELGRGARGWWQNRMIRAAGSKQNNRKKASQMQARPF